MALRTAAVDKREVSMPETQVFSPRIYRMPLRFELHAPGCDRAERCWILATPQLRSCL